MQNYKIYNENNDFEIIEAASKRELLKLKFNEDQIEKVEKVGLAIMRMQPFHKGHLRIIHKMMEEMDVIIIGIGSIQEKETINNPFSAAQRREMLRKVLKLGNKSNIKIIELADIGAVTKIAWATHVLGIISGKNLPRPTHYYAGSIHDASWFDSLNKELEEGFMNIVNLDRFQTTFMSGTDIRKSIIDGSYDWQEYVPSIIVDYIDEEFPNHLRLETMNNENENNFIISNAIDKMVKHQNISEEDIKKIITKI